MENLGSDPSLGPIRVQTLNKCFFEMNQICFYDFQCGFRSSQSTADLLTVVSDRIARAFNRSVATQAVVLDISKAFNRIQHAGLLHKLKSYGISGQILGLISSFLSNIRIRVVLNGKSSQEYPGNAGVPQISILGSNLFPKIFCKSWDSKGKYRKIGLGPFFGSYYGPDP